MKKENRFLNLLLRGGVSETRFKEAREQIREDNYKMWRTSSIIFEFFFLILFIFEFIFNFRKDNDDFGGVIVYGALVVYMLIFMLIFLLAIKKNSKAILPLSYLTNLVILLAFATTSLLSLSLDRHYFLFLIALVGISFFTVDRPARYSLFLLVAGGVFSTILPFVHPDKSTLELARNVLLSVFCTLFAAITAFYLNVRRLATYTSIKEITVERDTDALTGALNSSAYERAVDDINLKLKNHEPIAFAIALFDINSLKETNDTFGHSFGDELIVRASKLIRSIYKYSNVYRIGGDEFVAIILDARDYTDRDKLAEEFKEKVKFTHKTSTSLLDDLSVAFGLATYNQAIDYGYISVFSRADKEMYDNKRKIKGEGNPY